jgi:hypothetical protein
LKSVKFQGARFIQASEEWLETGQWIGCGFASDGGYIRMAPDTKQQSFHVKMSLTQ